MQVSRDDLSPQDEQRLRQTIVDSLGEPSAPQKLCPRCTQLPEYSQAVDEQDESLPPGSEGLVRIFQLREEGSTNSSEWADWWICGCPDCAQLYLYIMDFDGQPGQPWRHTRMLEKISFQQLCQRVAREHRNRGS